jgi:hypothetical protein
MSLRLPQLLLLLLLPLLLPQTTIVIRPRALNSPLGRSQTES